MDDNNEICRFADPDSKEQHLFGAAAFSLSMHYSCHGMDIHGSA